MSLATRQNDLEANFVPSSNNFQYFVLNKMKLVPYHPIFPSFFIVRAPYCWLRAVGSKVGIGGRQKTQARKKKRKERRGG